MTENRSGYAYVSSLHLSDIAQPFTETLSTHVHESVSAAEIDNRLAKR